MRRNYKERVCNHCELVFQPTTGNAKSCSEECSRIAEDLRLVTDVNHRIGKCFNGARSRCRLSGRRLEVTLEFLRGLWKEQKGVCALTGRKLLLVKGRHPHGPSLDRINSDGDYTEDNVRWVTVQANRALSDFGEEALKGFITDYLNYNKVNF